MTEIEPAEVPIPSNAVVVPDDHLVLRGDGTTDPHEETGVWLLGGSPFRILRLAADGKRIVRGWFAGQPIAPIPSHQKLARRLVDSGMAHLDFPSHSTASRPTLPATIVIPTKDDLQSLRASLEALGVQSGPLAGQDGPQIIVVDDGSEVSVAPERLFPESSAIDSISVVRRAVSGGPGVARNSALDRVATPVVLFLDAGVLLDEAGFNKIIAHFADPGVVAVAPRVRSTDPQKVRTTGQIRSAAERQILEYERHHSPLDMGRSSSLVGPGRRVPYVPTACLAVRTEALVEIGAFNPSLRYGEDVDLVWRLSEIGRVRYDADIETVHPPRSTVAEFVEQRYRYGSSAAALALDHGSAVAPARVRASSAAFWILVGTRRPVSAAAVFAWSCLRLRKRLQPQRDPRTRQVGDLRQAAMADTSVVATNLALRSIVGQVRALVIANSRAWWPISGPAGLVFPGLRKAVSMAYFLGAVRRSPRSLGTLTLGVLDDIAYSAGVWRGALAERSAVPLLPKFDPLRHRKSSEATEQ